MTKLFLLKRILVDYAGCSSKMVYKSAILNNNNNNKVSMKKFSGQRKNLFFPSVSVKW